MRNLFQRTLRDIRANPPLYWVGVAMLIDFIICLLLMSVDSRQITGVNAWLKPSKFAISSAITILSLSWIVAKLTDWPRTRRWASRLFALSMAIDVAIIDIQAARGTTSHFNFATLFDRTAYIVMGAFISVLWLAMAAFTYALLRQKITPAALAWALRLGLVLSLLGAASGGLMVPPAQNQLKTPEHARIGAHTVGAPDGGPGLPFANWSTRHGDLRVAHFLGLHAMQLIPLIDFWLVRRRSLDETRKLRLVFISAATCLAVFILLAWQALRGQALLHPDAKTSLAAGFIVVSCTVSSYFALNPEIWFGWIRTLEVEA